MERDGLLDHEAIRRVVDADIAEVKVRSPLNCELTHGICQKCYGMDLGRGTTVELGSAVGIVAAQSIGEPVSIDLRNLPYRGCAAGGASPRGLAAREEQFEPAVYQRGAVVALISWCIRFIQLIIQ